MSHLLHILSQQASPWAYVIVGVLAALESSAFVGLFVPGEIALLAGGQVLQPRHVALASMLIAVAPAPTWEAPCPRPVREAEA